MRNLSFLMLAFLVLNSFTVNKPATDEHGLTYNDLSCFRMKSKSVTHADYNIWVLTNRAALQENFEADSCAGSLDFDHNLVVAVKLETDNHTYRVTVSKITVANNAINVYFTSKRLNTPVEEGSPLMMAEVTRDRSIKKVNFYHGNALVRTVPVVTVY